MRYKKMKVNIKTNYIQLPLCVFAEMCPEFFDGHPHLLELAMTDSKYIIRFLPDMTRFEIGYPEDKHWSIS